MSNPDQQAAWRSRAAYVRSTMHAMRYRVFAAAGVIVVAAVAFQAVNRCLPNETAEVLADSSVPLSAVALSGCDVSGGVDAQALSAKTKTTAVCANYTVSVDMYRTTQLQSFAVQGWQAVPYTVSYASSDDAICTVDNAGLVSGVNAGSAIVTATATDADGNTASAACTVCVNSALPPLESITLNRQSVKLRMGGTGSNLSVSCAPEEYQASMPAAAFSSSDESICTVDETGHITAVAAGEATVTAAVGSLTADCAVTVLDTQTVNEGGINLLNFDHSMIAAIGNQTSGKCSWYALRYARTILDGQICSGAGMWGNGVIWSAGGYTDYSSDLSSCLSEMYNELNAGRPVIVHLQNTYVGDGGKHANRTSTYEYWEGSSGWSQVNYPHIATSAYYGHWVCVVGYRADADPANLQESDFYALDPARCTDGSSIAVTNLLNGTIWVGNSPLKIAG
ncbi:MAG: Ig-like domain-containing protein [Faecalibacterium sp.]|jgi:hypothetical protein|nr:Ig-like domain-containing protein [Faecalibacterium sp.]